MASLNVHDETLNTVIRRAVREMLDRCGGNKSDAARRLGISRTRLQRLLDPAARAESFEADLADDRSESRRTAV